MDEPSVDLTPVLHLDPLDLRLSMTSLTHWSASSQLRRQVMQEIAFPVDDIPMFLVVNQLTYRGAMRPTDLAAAMGTGVANISKLARRLEGLDLVVRVDSHRDDRSVLVALTPTGRTFGERILEGAARRFDRALATWSEDEVALFRRLLARFARDTVVDYRWMLLEAQELGRLDTRGRG